MSELRYIGSKISVSPVIQRYTAHELIFFRRPLARVQKRHSLRGDSTQH